MLSPWALISALLAMALVVVALGYVSQRRSDARLRFLLGGGRHTYSESILRMERELSRARRHQRPLSVAVLQIVEFPAAGKRRSLFPSRGSFSHDLIGYLMLGAIVRDALRDYDIIAYQPELNRYAVLLAECSQQQARETLRRIAERAWNTAGMSFRPGVAEFPLHGFVLEDLLKHAETDGLAADFATARPEMARASERV